MKTIPFLENISQALGSMALISAFLLKPGHAATIPNDGPPPGFGAEEILQKRPGESDSGFVLRTGPATRPRQVLQDGEDTDTLTYGPPELIHGPLSVAWNSRPVVLAIYADSVRKASLRVYHDNCSQTSETRTDHSEYLLAQGYVYAPEGKPGRYRRLFFGSLGAFDFGWEVQAVFFANADSDPRKEMAVLACSPADPSRGEGEDCVTRIFDDLDAARGDSLVYLKKVSDRLEMDVIPARGDRKERYVFYDLGTAAQVKARLKRLGY